MIAGVISAVAVAVLIGLGLWLRRRRNGQKSRETSQPPPTISRDLESVPRFEPQEGTGSGTAVLLDVGGHPTAPHDERPSHPLDAHAEADAMASNGEGIVMTSDATTPVPAPAVPAAPASAPPAAAPAVPAPATAPLAEAPGPPQAISRNPEQSMTSGKDSGAALGSGGAEESAAERSLAATVSTANMSTAEQAERAQFYDGQSVASAESVDVDGSVGMGTSTSGRRGSRGGIGLGEAVMEAAQNLAHHCQIPGVSEAAAVVSTLVTLVSDRRDIKSGGDSNLRKCRSIVKVLERASKVAGKVSLRSPRIPRRFVSRLQGRRRAETECPRMEKEINYCSFGTQNEHAWQRV